MPIYSCEIVLTDYWGARGSTTHSKKDFDYLKKLDVYFAKGMGTNVDKLSSFTKYVPRQTLTYFLSRYEIFKKILNVHGSIVECGVFFGAGLMTSIPVMGTALTKAHKLGNRASGSILLVDTTQFSQIPISLVSKTESVLSFINWWTDENSLAKRIAHKARLEFSTEERLRELFENYIKTEPCPPQKWIEGSRVGNVI